MGEELMTDRDEIREILTSIQNDWGFDALLDIEKMEKALADFPEFDQSIIIEHMPFDSDCDSIEKILDVIAPETPSQEKVEFDSIDEVLRWLVADRGTLVLNAKNMEISFSDISGFENEKKQVISLLKKDDFTDVEDLISKLHKKEEPAIAAEPAKATSRQDRVVQPKTELKTAPKAKVPEVASSPSPEKKDKEKSPAQTPASTYDSRPTPNQKYTRFEKARIIGARALQISCGAPVLVDYPEDMLDPIDIALLEYDQDMIPITVVKN